MQNILEFDIHQKSATDCTLKKLLSQDSQKTKSWLHKDQAPKNALANTLENNSETHHDLVLAGGHHNHFKLGQDGQVIIKSTSQKEIDFYKKHRDASSPFYNIIPKCLSFHEKDGTISLENLTANMKNPQVIDIKIGTHSFSGQKKPGLIGFKEALQRRAKWYYRDIKYGFRQRGWRVQGCSWIKDQDRSEIGIHSKKYIDEFFQRTDLNHEQLKFIQSKFKEIAEIIQKENYGFINASIMIAVDGDSEPKVKFIDFAHVIEYKSQKEKIRSHQNKGPVKGALAISEIFQNKLENLDKP